MPGYARHHPEIAHGVDELVGLVRDEMRGAVDALLRGDRMAGAQLARRGEQVDRLRSDLESSLQAAFATRAPVAGELRYLLAVLRALPEIERAGDLAVHVAARAARDVGSGLDEGILGVVRSMYAEADGLWHAASSVIRSLDAIEAEAVGVVDDRLDALYRSGQERLFAAGLSVVHSIETAEVLGALERFGDHAVAVCARMRYASSATGSANSLDCDPG
jgi:phosphate transport system protein